MSIINCTLEIHKAHMSTASNASSRAASAISHDLLQLEKKRRARKEAVQELNKGALDKKLQIIMKEKCLFSFTQQRCWTRRLLDCETRLWSLRRTSGCMTM
ncbi:hypothetical protein PsorP6_014200 [Peronosclerospora sorghi]|uniref:Uncharacterized protein n=1 Tax=Peronosclerospora sorghi TaxID=230839 RepID=A0ACC0VFR3_9STRA|nr:hypothetical protein PsorP6_014200 [Peronosclerospora sorghi]